MKKNPICTIVWQDAAYSFEKEPPIAAPLPKLTTGFIVEATDEYTFIASNVSYDRETGVLNPVDGIIIPVKATIEFRKIADYNEANE